MAKKAKILKALRAAALPVVVGSIVGLLLLAVVSIYMDEAFTVGCDGYIQMAARAPTIEDAKRNLDTAIEYVEKHELTDGKTSIIFHSPRDSVLCWYLRLRVVQQQLHMATELGVTTSEREIVFNRLHRSLMRMSSGSKVVVSPSGISRYPYNTPHFVSIVLLLLLLTAALFIQGGKPYVHSRADW